MQRYKNPGPGSVPLASGRIIDVGEIFDYDGDIEPEDLATIDRGQLVAIPDDTKLNLAIATDEQLAVWVAANTVKDVLSAAADNSELAARLLAAENTRDEPRKGVVDGLTTNEET